MPISHQELAKSEEMFITVIPHQRFPDRLFRGADASVSKTSQPLGIALTRPDGIDHVQTGAPGDVADDVMNLKAHLVESPLHVLKVNRGHLDQAVAMAPQRTKGTDLLSAELAAR
jgi:hypothetical protein